MYIIPISDERGLFIVIVNPNPYYNGIIVFAKNNHMFDFALEKRSSCMEVYLLIHAN